MWCLLLSWALAQPVSAPKEPPPSEVAPAVGSPSAEEEAVAKADSLYRAALEAWQWGRWREAYEYASQASSLNPDDEPAQLLEGFALSRMGQWEDGLDLVRPLQDSEEVGPHARFWVRRHDRRWTRDDWALAFAVLLRPDRDREPRWFGGLAATVDVPLADSFTVRVDATTPIRHVDELKLFGVGVSAVPLAHLNLRTWSFHAGLGPHLTFGVAEAWVGDFIGVFPGLRGTLGVDARMSRRSGMRLQVDYDATVGARRWLRGVSHGPTLRWSYVIYL